MTAFFAIDAPRIHDFVYLLSRQAKGLDAVGLCPPTGFVPQPVVVGCGVVGDARAQASCLSLLPVWWLWMGWVLEVGVDGVCPCTGFVPQPVARGFV